MELQIDEDPRAKDISVRIVCPFIDEQVEAIAASVNALDRRLVGVCEGKTHIIDAADILYADTVDGRTFLYTRTAVLESRLRLREVEEALGGTGFVRASRSLLVNFDHVKALRPFANARLELILSNDEHLIASRQYAPAIKHKIGL